MAQRCSATREDGSTCRAWARAGTEPPLCNFHTLTKEEQLEQSRRGGRAKGRRDLPLDWQECAWVLDFMTKVLTGALPVDVAEEYLAAVLTSQAHEQDELRVLLERLVEPEPEPKAERLEAARQQLLSLYREGRIGLGQLSPELAESFARSPA